MWFFRKRVVHWTRDTCELFRGKQLMDFFVLLSVVSLGGDLCNGKPWWGYWLSEPACPLHFLSWSFSHDLYCSKRTGQNFGTLAAAPIPVFLNLSWDKANSGLKRLSWLELPSHFKLSLLTRAENQRLISPVAVCCSAGTTCISRSARLGCFYWGPRPSVFSLAFHPPLQKASFWVPSLTRYLLKWDMLF